MRIDLNRTRPDDGHNGPQEPGFPIRWRGYDRRAVDRYVEQLTSDYRRLEAKLAFLDHLIVGEEVPQPLRASMTPGGASNGSHHPEAAPSIHADTLPVIPVEAAPVMPREAAPVIHDDHPPVVDLDPTPVVPVDATPVTPVIQSAPDHEKSPSESIDATVETTTPEPGGAAGTTSAPARSLFTSMSGRWSTQQTSILIASVISGLAFSSLLYSGADGRPGASPTVATSDAGQRGDNDGTPGRRRMTDIALSPLSAGGDSLVTQGGTPPVKSSLMVLLHAERECWVRATVDGQRGTEYLLKAGAELTLRAADEVLLRIGDASALRILVNGERLSDIGRSGQVVTRRITRDQTRERTLEAL